jgi:MFS family permease
VGDRSALLSPGFLIISLQFGLVTAIAALFFAFSGYLTQLGLSPATVGFILSADALAALIIQPLITPFVHSGTARRWLVIGSLLFSAALFIVGHVSSVPWLIAARLLQGTGFIFVMASLITMIVSFIPAGMSGRAFGYISLVRLVPYAIIPAFFDLFAIAPSSFDTVLTGAAVAALLPLLVLMLPSSTRAGGADRTGSPGLTGMVGSLRDHSVLFLLISALLFFCSYSAAFFYIKEFGVSKGIIKAGLFFTTATVTMIVVRLLFSWGFDRYNKVLLCAAGLLSVAACYGLLPLCKSNFMFQVLAIVAGLGWGIAMPLQSAVMFDISVPSVRAMNQNLLLVMMQGGFFAGPLLGGQLISHYGYTALFAGLAISGLASALMMAGVRLPVSGNRA